MSKFDHQLSGIHITETMDIADGFTAGGRSTLESIGCTDGILHVCADVAQLSIENQRHLHEGAEQSLSTIDCKPESRLPMTRDITTAFNSAASGSPTLPTQKNDHEQTLTWRQP